MYCSPNILAFYGKKTLAETVLHKVLIRKGKENFIYELGLISKYVLLQNKL
jgi:hypothetical protein